MLKSFPKNPHFHFIGIGGIGMSALALILANRGYSVSGSDQSFNESINALIFKGIRVFKSQAAKNIDTICSYHLSPFIIVSTAIPETNPEFRAAKNAKLEILHRSDLLASLINSQPSIVVGGSHGKTTTSTIITTLLAVSKKDPSVVIGGFVPFYKSNSHAGTGEFLVAEADESDGTIVKFKGEIGVLTNLELDHTNYYLNLRSLIKTIKKFNQNCKRFLANYDCPTIRNNFKSSIWWSTITKEKVNYAAIPILITGKETIANYYEDGHFVGEIKIPLPGLHNLNNVTAAIAACRLVGISFKNLKEALKKLEAPNRRFQFRGIWNKRQIVDDYAHHPSEISATLSMSNLMISSQKSTLPEIPKRIVAIFQPHRFSRTRDFIDDFAKALLNADEVIIAPIYAAGEKEIDGINNQFLANCIKQKDPTLPVTAAYTFDDVINQIKNKTYEGDLILNLGAGDINQVWGKLENQKPDLITIPPIEKVA